MNNAVYNNTGDLYQYLKDADKWLCDNGIYHFSVDEVFFLGEGNETVGFRGYGTNHLPPKKLWGNMLPTISIVEKARVEFNSRIGILSGFRGRIYNQHIKGRSQSRHLTFGALDLLSIDKPQQELWELLTQYRHEGIFTGGIGQYNDFTHIDVGGRNRTWKE